LFFLRDCVWMLCYHDLPCSRALVAMILWLPMTVPSAATTNQAKRTCFRMFLRETAGSRLNFDPAEQQKHQHRKGTDQVE